MSAKLVFVGSFTSFEDSKKSRYFSQAGNLYQEKLISFLKPDICISILPMFVQEKYVFSYRVPVKFINNQSLLPSNFNKIYRLLFDTAQTLKIIRGNKSSDVLFYNIDVQNFLIVLLSKYIFKRNIYVVVADYTGEMPGLFNKFIKRLLYKISGVIILNSNINCNKNSQLMPGLLYKKDIVISDNGSVNSRVIMSGSLGKTTGFELALECFSNKPECELIITGKPFRYSDDEFKLLIEKYVSNSSNIKYFGMLEYDEYAELMSGCDIALSLRNPENDEHAYNFPSKILEYLSASKFVISTLKYNDLPSDMIFFSEFNAISLSKKIDDLLMFNSESVIDKRRKIHSFLVDNYSEDKLIKAMALLKDE